jgi:uncharacterized protein YcfJ
MSTRTPVSVCSRAIAAALGLVLVAGVARADPYGEDDGRYAEGPGYDYARVLDVQPRYRDVRVDVPERQCWEEQRDAGRYPERGGVAGPMILGGLIGGVLGHGIGHGDGRRLATVAGAVIGTAIGHDVGERARDRDADYDDAPRTTTVQRCQVRYTPRYDRRVDGYDVAYEYGGRRYRTQLPYDPGQRLKVAVAVTPAER